ncbi:actin family [Dimargaris cristalligena]|uniref:Actin family n=1 Tax=Dimargaris cristalligena TaxID=215637 RepID=A0A4Q0A1N7_9FUNG|nr:actin family [Dimargaris cristalligena]|eukprot:RKP39698.1 actin family [Dimargaris cristalligena]
MVIYCGDEVSALVVDVGGSWIRAGYAGEDTPKVVVPSWVGSSEVTEDEASATTKTIRNSKADSQDPDVEMGDATASQSGSSSKDAAGGQGDVRVKNEPGTCRKYYIGDTQASTWRPNMDIKTPLEDGLVADWDIYENIWNYCFYNRLRVQPEENPLFVTEVAWNTPSLREKMVELAFEKFNCPAFYVSKDPVLTAFASGKPTGLVLDCGGTTTSAVAVFDGYVLKKGQTYQNIAGDFISEQILAQLKQDYQKEVVPRYRVAQKSAVGPGEPAKAVLRDRPNTAPSFDHRMQMQAIHEYKETVCQISETTFDLDALKVRPQKPYEFPDGYNLQVGVQRYQIPEILFQPDKFIVDKTREVRLNGKAVSLSANTGVNGTGSGNATAKPLGIPRMIYDCISACDTDVRPHLFSNIILTGGSTLFPGFVDRVNYELQGLAPGQRIKIQTPGNTAERKFGTWLGGSILSSLGSFHQLWISKQEYQDSGASIVNKKCQ